MVEHLTKSELAIMEVMWDQEDALTATEISLLKIFIYARYYVSYSFPIYHFIDSLFASFSLKRLLIESI